MRAPKSEANRGLAGSDRDKMWLAALTQTVQEIRIDGKTYLYGPVTHIAEAKQE